jgi:hypothetical protein
MIIHSLRKEVIPCLTKLAVKANWGDKEREKLNAALVAL